MFLILPNRSKHSLNGTESFFSKPQSSGSSISGGGGGTSTSSVGLIHLNRKKTCRCIKFLFEKKIVSSKFHQIGNRFNDTIHVMLEYPLIYKTNSKVEICY